MNINKFKKKVNSILASKIINQKNRLERESTEILQNTIKGLDVYDTGNLRGSSTAQVFVFSDVVILRLKTDGSLAPYWSYPRNGWGTSAKIGPRKYDLVAGEKIKKTFSLK